MASGWSVNKTEKRDLRIYVYPVYGSTQPRGSYTGTTIDTKNASACLHSMLNYLLEHALKSVSTFWDGVQPLNNEHGMYE
jgi:hypothetical protein